MNNDDNKKATEALLKGIEIIINKKINQAPMDKTYTGIIKKIKENNLYDVLMQGMIYENVPSIFNNFLINDIVKIKVPQNQISLMYIDGKFNLDIKGGIIEGGSVTSVNGQTGNVTIKEDKEYIHNQSLPSNKWEIKHNLNKYPSVTIIDNENDVVIGDIHYLDKNNLTIDFTLPLTGKALLN